MEAEVVHLHLELVDVYIKDEGRNTWKNCNTMDIAIPTHRAAPTDFFDELSSRTWRPVESTIPDKP